MKMLQLTHVRVIKGSGERVAMALSEYFISIAAIVTMTAVYLPNLSTTAINSHC